MNLDPFSGDVVIFVGRRRRAVKVLYVDPTGLYLTWKKFTMEAMKTDFKFLVDPGCESITTAELAMLLEGSSYTIRKKVKQYTQAMDSVAAEVFASFASVRRLQCVAAAGFVCKVSSRIRFSVASLVSPLRPGREAP